MEEVTRGPLSKGRGVRQEIEAKGHIGTCDPHPHQTP